MASAESKTLGEVKRDELRGVDTDRVDVRISRLVFDQIDQAVEGGEFVDRSGAVRHAVLEKFVFGVGAPSISAVGDLGTAPGPTTRVGVRFPQGLVDAWEAAIDEGHYANRSEAIRDALRDEFDPTRNGGTS